MHEHSPPHHTQSKAAALTEGAEIGCHVLVERERSWTVFDTDASLGLLGVGDVQSENIRPKE
eukprot:1095703-Rhodomonas_salina.3